MTNSEHLFDLDVFIREVRELLPSALLDKEGGVLNSTAETLRPGNLYILGLNPGGKLGGGVTIRQDLEDLRRKTRNDYFEQWGNYAAGNMANNEPGRHPIQRGLWWLTKELGYDLRKICASNLIFARSHAAGFYPVSTDR